MEGKKKKEEGLPKVDMGNQTPPQGSLSRWSSPEKHLSLSPLSQLVSYKTDSEPSTKLAETKKTICAQAR